MKAIRRARSSREKHMARSSAVESPSGKLSSSNSGRRTSLRATWFMEIPRSICFSGSPNPARSNTRWPG